jgi:hypothetical protein
MNHSSIRFWRMAFFAYMVVLLTIFLLAYLGLIPTKMQRLPLFDTLGHFILLGLASFLSHRALNRKSFCLGPLKLPAGPACSSLFIITEECLQSLSPIRSTTWSDMLANLSGIILFVLFDEWMAKKNSFSHERKVET